MNSNSIQSRIGSATISRSESVVAGELINFTITYTAGYFGIDDSGSIKICTRFATDMGRPQFTAPDQLNYVSIVASNGATLEYRLTRKTTLGHGTKQFTSRSSRAFFVRETNFLYIMVIQSVVVLECACKHFAKIHLN